MGWQLFSFAAAGVAWAVCMRLAYLMGREAGRNRTVTVAEFAELAACKHEWTDVWMGEKPDGSRWAFRACLHCEARQEQRISG